MNKQELFDTVCRHLMKQRARSVSKEKIFDTRFGCKTNRCLYRSPDGKKCAIGCLIPDEKYNPDFENKIGFFVLRSLGGILDLGASILVENLQKLHDNPKLSPRKDWKPTLREIASDHGLEEPDCIKDKPVKWTAQKIFNKVYKHLLTQGRRSEVTLPDGSSVCLYRGPDNTKCAAGCLIPDDRYNKNMENKPWRSIIGAFPEFKDHEHLIDRLQILHDAVHTSDWETSLTRLASEFNLKVPKWKPKKQSI